MKNYIPEPIDTSEITLPREVEEVVELIAKNIHEIWAKSRIEQGWHYGPQRNDIQKEHPGLVPYDHLSESEKGYDRNTGLETIKLLIQMGFAIKKTM